MLFPEKSVKSAFWTCLKSYRRFELHQLPAQLDLKCDTFLRQPDCNRIHRSNSEKTDFSDDGAVIVAVSLAGAGMSRK